MNIENSKTIVDSWLENYLIQEGFKFQYEPYSNKLPGNKNPDYKIWSAEKVILAECKEIDQFILDRVVGTGSMDIQKTWNLIRGKIKEASEQLKPYVDDVDHTIVILGKSKGFNIDSLDLYHAMFGNPIMRIPIDTKTGVATQDPSFDMTPSGALRKNRPKTKERYYPHNYINGIGIIEEFSAFNYYEEKFYNELLAKHELEKRDIPLSEQLAWAFDLMSKEWKNHKIPDEYSDPQKKLYKLRFIKNPLSENPLPSNFFHGQYDHIISPEVVSEFL